MAVRFPFEHIPKVLVRGRLHEDQGTNRLKDHVTREVNGLYRRYLTTLTREEITAYWPAGPFSYFMATSISMLMRGYQKAAAFAVCMAFRHLYKGTIRQVWHARPRSGKTA